MLVLALDESDRIGDQETIRRLLDTLIIRIKDLLIANDRYRLLRSTARNGLLEQMTRLITLCDLSKTDMAGILYDTVHQPHANDNTIAQVVELILSTGSYIDAKTICWAASHGYMKTMEVLWNAGCSLHVYEDAPLRRAAQYGHYDVVKFIIDNSDPADLDLSAQNDYAIIYAQNNRHVEVAALLRQTMIERGLDPDRLRSHRRQWTYNS